MSPRRRTSPSFHPLSEAFWGFFGVSGSSRNKNSSSLFSRFFQTLGKREGSALVMAAIFMVVATMLITIAFKMVANSARSSKESALYVGEAENVARAGLVDALGWYARQQANGGVVAGAANNTATFGQIATPLPGFSNVDQAFNPQNNTANSQLSDTIDASIGLVKEYPLDDPVTAKALYWGRYEVVRQQATPIPNAVQDVTGKRSTNFINGDGFVWNIVANGYVYKRLDKTVNSVTGLFSVPMTTAPNSLVAQAVFSTELRKLSLVMPDPIPGDGNSAGLYVHSIHGQVTLSSNQTMLYGAVSQIGTFAAMGMTSPQ